MELRRTLQREPPVPTLPPYLQLRRLHTKVGDFGYSTALALAAYLVAGSASAVALGASGVGQVLIYPYYTVRTSPGSSSPYNSLLSIVNGTSLGKVVKLRFREALAGASVFEVNVFLSARGVWTTAVVPVTDGAMALTTDKSCTVPSLIAPSTPSLSPNYFSGSAYASDPLGSDPGRMREGFVEVLEMGSIRPSTALEGAVTPIAGKPTCILGSDTAIAADLDPPSGRLYGSLTLVNVLEGTAYEYDAAALEQWSTVAQYSPPGSGRPTLDQAVPAVSSVFTNGKLLVSTWDRGLDAVNAVLSAGTTQAEFMREATVNGATDIVYTFPTKPLAVSTTQAVAPFFQTLTSMGACEPSVDYSLSRDEEVYFPDQDLFGYGIDGDAAMCWASTVQSLNATWPNPTAVLGSHAGLRHFIGGLEHTVPLPTKFSAGIAGQAFVRRGANRDLRPAKPTSITDVATGVQVMSNDVVYSGLPVIGVTMMRYQNGVVPVSNVQTLSNYGAGSTVKSLPYVITTP